MMPGLATRRGAKIARRSARGDRSGRFALLERAEGDRNPMRGGSALWNDLVPALDQGRARLPGRRAVASRGVRRAAPTAAGHALKGMVSEESWKNRRVRARTQCACPARAGRAKRYPAAVRAACCAALRTDEERGTARKLWTST
jgi:hypothetical protein